MSPRRATPGSMDASRSCGRCRTVSCHRRDVDEHQADPAAWPGPEGRAAARCGPLRSLAEPNLHCRPALSWADGPMAHRGCNGSSRLRHLHRDTARSHLAPTLQAGDVVILDNLKVHESPRPLLRWPRGAPGSCFSQPTRPTSIPSRWHSPSSRPICEEPAPGLMTRSGAPSAISAACSSPENAGTSSGTPAMLPIKRTTL